LNLNINRAASLIALLKLTLIALLKLKIHEACFTTSLLRHNSSNMTTMPVALSTATPPSHDVRRPHHHQFFSIFRKRERENNKKKKMKEHSATASRTTMLKMPGAASAIGFLRDPR
jgi:hypothetical protein